MTKLDWHDVSQALKKMKELGEKAAITPRTWGGPLEEIYEKYFSLQMAAQNETEKAWDDKTGREGKEYLKYLEIEHKYRDIVDTLISQYPHLLVWAKANHIGLSH